jgi:hypothetical protein
MQFRNKFGIILIAVCLAVLPNCASDRENSGDTTQTGSNEASGSGGQISSEKNKSNENASPANSDNSPGVNNAPANSVGIESVYTDLAADKCKTIESNEEEAGWIVQECPGVSLYKLEVTEGDLRQTINVIATSGDKWELDFPGNVSPAFSSFGEKAEWRVKRIDGRLTPIALITRYNVAESPENPEKTTSYLVVAKISGEFICITDIVKPMPNANEKARELADNSANKPCLQAK